MLSTSEILSTLAGLGVTARAVGDVLRLIPGSKVPPELLPEIRQHKSEILDALRTPTTPPSEVPDPKAGPEAAADALVLAGMIDEDPTISLDDIRTRAAAVGIEGLRFAHGLAALPPEYDAGPGSQEKLDAFLNAQPQPAGDIAGEVLDELKTEAEPLPPELCRWPSEPRYVCALLARRGMSQRRAIEGTRRWYLLGADLRAALAMGWADAEALLKDAGVQCEGGVG